jgi:hypothetical protein
MNNRNPAAQLFGAALLLGLTMPAFAQDDAQAAKFKEKLDKNMKNPFLSKVTWVTDNDKAKAKAATDGKLIFAYFTRSYSP